MRRRVIGSVVVAIAASMAACSPLGEPTMRSPVSTGAPSAATAMPSQVPAASAPATSTARPAALASLRPVAGTDLPLAGRDGAPGLVRCNRVGPTTLEALTEGPVGAELLAGPKYDVLRATIARYGDDPEFAPLKGATFREFRLDDGLVQFLGDIGSDEGTFPTVTAAFDGTRWAWAGMDGACQVTGEPGAGWGNVNWTVDRAFDRPTARTRELHLLATEAECTRAAPLAGRLAPAYVFLEPDRVRVQLFARTVEVGAACDGIEPTAVTLSLPEPLGDRALKDANPEPCGGCGG